MNVLYKRIDDLCKQGGISVTQMCKESGASRGSLGDLKADRITGLNTSTLGKIADYFNISIDELIGNESTKKEPADPLVYMSANRQATIYELFTERIRALNETEANVAVRSGAKNNIFPRLKNGSLSSAAKEDMMCVADYLGVSDKLQEILSQEDKASEEMKEIMSKIGKLNTQNYKIFSGFLETLLDSQASE